ncbi:hypothetical protein [uncultured Nevskia sp.]|uniref:hypothetical protein n=1 Tax=uncultured Nevskia sp. TaxID=228950 RepID=UPI0025DA17E5|nr:hypothetical protein [uncultured Nevskia sp.]
MSLLKFPPRQYFQRWLTLPAIQSGKDRTVLPVKLVWALLAPQRDGVKYQLTGPAAKRYRFDPDKPLSFDINGADRTSALEWEVSADSLVVTINPNDTNWTEGKATFFFVGLNGTTNPPPFDPTIGNAGGPRPNN